MRDPNTDPLCWCTGDAGAPAVEVTLVAATVPGLLGDPMLVGALVVDGDTVVDDAPSVVLEGTAPLDGDGRGVKPHGLAAAVTPLL